MARGVDYKWYRTLSTYVTSGIRWFIISLFIFTFVSGYNWITIQNHFRHFSFTILSIFWIYCHLLKKLAFNLSVMLNAALCHFVLILGKCVKVQRKQALVSSSDSSNKHSPSNKRSLVPSPVAHRPLRDRIIHLLALKPYRKPELLLWLERERASLKDKADLTLVLDEVSLLTDDEIY